MNRWVFRARRNECRVDAAVTVDGRLFHALAAVTRNARSPSDDLLIAGKTSAGKLDDLRRCLGSIRVTCWHGDNWGNSRRSLRLRSHRKAMALGPLRGCWTWSSPGADLVGAVVQLVEYGLVTKRLRVRLTPGPLQATLSELLTYCVLRST